MRQIPFYLAICLTFMTIGRASAADPTQAGVPIQFELPQPAHVTLAINDDQGERVRNLVADIELPAGPQKLWWDGLDDDGRALPPAKYQWIGLSRGDLHAVYRGAATHGSPPWQYGETGGWAADHACAQAVIRLGKTMMIGSHTTEGGSGILSTDLEGNKRWGRQWLNRMAWAGADSLVTDGERVFAGCIPGWLGQDAFRVWEINPQNGESWYVVTIPKAKDGQPAVAAPFNDVRGLRVVGAHRTGKSRWDGELYVCDILSKQPRTFVYSTARVTESNETGYDDQSMMPLLRVLPLRIWGLTWLPDGRCIAALDHSVVELNTETGASTAFANKSSIEEPFAITSDAKGRVFVSDWGGENPPTRPDRTMNYQGLRKSANSSMQVKIFDATGKLLRALGKPGGAGTPDGHHERPGVIDPNDFFFPAGIAVDSNNHLWVTELTIQPKRVSVWEISDDIAKVPAKLLHQLRGRPQYGEALFMVDPKRPNLLLSQCQGVLWDVDLAKQTYRQAERQYHSTVSNDMYSGIGVSRVHLNERTFAKLADFSFDQTVLGELKDERFQPLTCIGVMTERSYSWPEGIPEPLKAALRHQAGWEAAAQKAKLDPTLKDLKPADAARWPAAFNGYLWTDANGDGLWQPEEVKFHELHYVQSISWTFDHNLNAIVNLGGHQYRMPLKGFNAVGAPQYDLAEMKLLDLRSLGHRPHVANSGSILYPRTDDRRLRLMDPSGRQRWSYPVASHDGGYASFPPADSMKPGVIHGENGLQGVVPGPTDIGDVFMLHGWHGMNYLFTRDTGLLIGTVFKPHSLFKHMSEIPEAKPGMLMDEYSLGGENFGGSLARAEATVNGFEKGHYYILGYSFNMIIELTGLDSLQRLPGRTLPLNEEVVAHNRAEIIRRAAANWDESQKYAAIDVPPQGGVADIGVPNPSASASVQLWHSPQGLGVRAIYNAAPGSFGRPELLFASDAEKWEDVYAHGDAVELQLGPESNTSAEFAQQRIFITQFEGKPTFLRYRRMPVTKLPEGSKVLEVGRTGDIGWVADKLEVLRGSVNRQVGLDSYVVSVEAVLPWQPLGINYQPNLKFRGNFGGVWRQVNGRPVWRGTQVGDIGAAIVDNATALEMHPEFWQPIVLRAANYTPSPDLSQLRAAPKDEPLAIKPPQQGQSKPARFAADAFSWVGSTEKGLTLKWYVAKDDSPFVNGGKDWTALFKTGDGCDLQIQSPVLGPCRYLISMFNGQPTVVRYVYQATGRDDDFRSGELAAKWRKFSFSAGEAKESVGGGMLVMNAKSIPVGGVEDGCRFLAQQVVGDFDMSVKVADLGTAENSAGLMVRERNSQRERTFHIAFRQQEPQVAHVGHRDATGGETVDQSASGSPAPAYIRITRHGNEFTAYTSPEGKAWQQAGDVCKLALQRNAFAGVFLSGAWQPAQASFSEFRLADEAVPKLKDSDAVVFKSPVSQVVVPRVEKLDLSPTVERGEDWYTLNVTIPWDVLMIEPTGTVAAELGVLRSDKAGGVTTRRDYWHSGLTGIVQDVPTEVVPTKNWGEFRFE